MLVLAVIHSAVFMFIFSLSFVLSSPFASIFVFREIICQLLVWQPVSGVEAIATIYDCVVFFMRYDLDERSVCLCRTRAQQFSRRLCAWLICLDLFVRSAKFESKKLFS